MKHEVSYAVALGAMNLIANGTSSADFNTFGLSREDYELYAGHKSWTAMDRVTIERVANVIMHGVMDVIGTPRFPVSAEYIAANIAVFVSPTNVQIACSWLARAPSNGDMIEGANSLNSEDATAEQIFALVLECKSHNADVFRTRFEARTGLIVLQDDDNAA